MKPAEPLSCSTPPPPVLASLSATGGEEWGSSSDISKPLFSFSCSCYDLLCNLIEHAGSSSGLKVRAVPGWLQLFTSDGSMQCVWEWWCHTTFLINTVSPSLFSSSPHFTSLKTPIDSVHPQSSLFRNEAKGLLWHLHVCHKSWCSSRVPLTICVLPGSGSVREGRYLRLQLLSLCVCVQLTLWHCMLGKKGAEDLVKLPCNTTVHFDVTT